MVTSKSTMDQIKKIIEKHYRYMTVSLLGKGILNATQIQELKDAGVTIPENVSIIELIYNHNFINSDNNPKGPKTLAEVVKQQSDPKVKLPKGEAHSYTIENLNDKMKGLLEKMRLDVESRIELIIRDNNDKYKMNALQNLNRDKLSDRLVKESSLGKVKQLLRDTSGNANRDWQRVALTEMSNAIGAGSVDRIVSNNVDKNLDEVYVYRLPVNDAATCKYCRKFYGDAGEIPKIYKLSSLLGNGSNYGKKPSEWKPVTGASHPNTRTSQVLELRPGFKLNNQGVPSYMGLEKWQEWVFEHLEY